MPFADMREFIARADAAGELRRVDGADLHLEVGALTEMCAFQPDQPALLFDNFAGFPAGRRVLTNALNNQRRVAWALDLPENARRYVARLETVSGVPAALISTGSERGDTILRDDILREKLPAFVVPVSH